MKGGGDKRSKAEGSSQNTCNRCSLKPVLLTLPSVHMLMGLNEEAGETRRKQILQEPRGEGAEHTKAGTGLRWGRSFTLGKESEHRDRAGRRQAPPLSRNGKQGSELTGREMLGTGPVSPPPLGLSNPLEHLPLGSNSTSLCLSFPLYEMGSQMAATSYGCSLTHSTGVV